MSSYVSIKSDTPSPYIESRGLLYRLKRRLTYSFAFRLLNRFLKRRHNLEVLEIGTGSGFFLEFASDYFLDSHFTGVEYDQRLLLETSHRAPFATLVQGNAEDFNLGTDFDLVVSFQVIEHLYNPTAMIANVKRHMKPGATLIITTPNLSGFGAKIMKNKWHGYRDDHVSLKSKDSWDLLISSHGFSCLYSGSTFFSGLPILNRLPLGLINWFLLLTFGSLPWSLGESYVGVFQSND